MGKVRCLVLVVLNVLHLVFGARILSVMPIAAKSHHNMINAVLKTLAQRGHQVVNYSAFPLDKPPANYIDVHLDSVGSVDKLITPEVLSQMMNEKRPMNMLWNFKPNIGQHTLENEAIKTLLKSDEKFDLVILEPLFAQEVLLSLGYKYQAPVIGLQPFGSFVLLNKVMGNSLSLSTMPQITFFFSDQMNFYERLCNSYSMLITLWDYYTMYLPTQNRFLKDYFNDKDMPPIEDMVHNISLFFNNAHPNIHYSQSITPNIIPIGGIHLTSSKQPELPSDMKAFLDGAKDGVIYFSLGSFLPDHHLPKTYFDNFTRVFRRLPQRVVWKTSSQLTNLPDNIMTVKWVPQQRVLAHKAIRLFLTHGGLFSQHEAINAGIPVVCIPFLGDQPLNAKFYETRSIGVVLPFNTLSEDSIYTALTTVLNNSTFKSNAQDLSGVYNDRPLSPANSLVFWVEYVIRHRGAHNLRPTSAHLSWYQLALLDIIGTLLVSIVGLVSAMYGILRALICIFNSKKANTLKVKKS